jgi:hypothetical protein
MPLALFRCHERDSASVSGEAPPARAIAELAVFIIYYFTLPLLIQAFIISFSFAIIALIFTLIFISH